MQSPTERLLVRVEDGVGWIVFNHPERHNALTPDMLAALPEVARALDADPAVRVVVMRGAGERAFVSGGDIRQLDALDALPQKADAPARATGALPLSKPAIAMIHGWCFGGGLLYALAADLRIAADDAVFAIPVARLGVGYPYESVRALVAAVGPGAASEILLTGARFGAEDALRMGLVQRVLPKAELEKHVRGLAAQIAAGAPFSQRAARASIRRIAGDPGAPDEATCRRWIAECWSSADRAEGQQAFLEKRAPQFRGA
ncbi:MAG TPA: enoyl-CoA hydratase-related protein [Myxococcota bacterium]|nr:enoyl-CoA hydratase-related protein [Myxococcota bacterium]